MCVLWLRKPPVAKGNYLGLYLLGNSRWVLPFSWNLRLDSDWSESILVSSFSLAVLLLRPMRHESVWRKLFLLCWKRQTVRLDPLSCLWWYFLNVTVSHFEIKQVVRPFRCQNKIKDGILGWISQVRLKFTQICEIINSLGFNPRVALFLIFLLLLLFFFFTC